MKRAYAPLPAPKKQQQQKQRKSEKRFKPRPRLALSPCLVPTTTPTNNHDRSPPLLPVVLLETTTALWLIPDLWEHIRDNIHSLVALMRWHSLDRKRYKQWGEPEYFTALCKRSIEWNQRCYGDGILKEAGYFLQVLHWSDVFIERSLASLLIENALFPAIREDYHTGHLGDEIPLLDTCLDSPTTGVFRVGVTIGELLERYGRFTAAHIADQEDQLDDKMQTMMRRVAEYVEVLSGWIVAYENMSCGVEDVFSCTRFDTFNTESKIAFSLTILDENHDDDD